MRARARAHTRARRGAGRAPGTCGCKEPAGRRSTPHEAARSEGPWAAGGSGFGGWRSRFRDIAPNPWWADGTNPVAVSLLRNADLLLWLACFLPSAAPDDSPFHSEERDAELLRTAMIREQARQVGQGFTSLENYNKEEIK
jgi:hypothetical protein